MIMAMRHLFINFLHYFRPPVMLLLIVVMASCDKHDVAPVNTKPEKIMPDIRTGPATFHTLGGVVETFNVNFEKLGNVPIDEYGIAYVFQVEATLTEPVADGANPVAKFKSAAKQGPITETFKIGFPVGTHAFAYRAYVKIKGGDVLYAENSFKITY